MFKNLVNKIKQLNADVSDVTNQQKAKQLRKTLFIWGGVLVGVGILLVIGALGAILGFMNSAVHNDGIPNIAFIIVPIILITLGFVVGGIGVALIYLAVGIIVVGVGSKFLDNSFNNRCECGYSLTNEDEFCPKCGRQVVHVCPACGFKNGPKDLFCKKCGQNLKEAPKQTEQN